MAKQIFAYISVGLLGLVVILAIATASLPSFFETSTTSNSDGTKTHYQLGPFKTCLNVAYTRFDETKCEQSGTDCRLVSYSRGNVVHYGYSGDCGYYNMARGFLLLGIFSCIGAMVLIMYTLMKKSGQNHSTLFYALSVGSCAFIALWYVISFASVVVFEKDVHESFLQNAKVSNIFVNPTSYGAAFYLDIFCFVLSLAAGGVFAWFGRNISGGNSGTYPVNYVAMP